MEISLTSKQVREQTAESAAPKRSPEYSSEDKIPHIWANIPRQQAKEKRKKRKEEAALFISSPPTAVFQASVKSSPCLVFLMICSSLFQASVALFVWGFVLGTMRALHRAQNPRCDFNVHLQHNQLDSMRCRQKLELFQNGSDSRIEIWKRCWFLFVRCFDQ